LSHKKIAWKPTDKQTLFLAAPENEVLYGGAAGGGKSDALLVDALGLQQNALEYNNYKALIIRRTFQELRELIDRSREIYRVVSPAAKYLASDKYWRFPSGAVIEFGYLEREQDRHQYQGRQYQWIGWDELTQWPTPISYEYLMSRLRSVNPKIQCYCRATTNPGGIGHKWVKARWGIDDSGAATSSMVEIDGRVFRRRFIPAKLSDNIHFDNSGYREQLMQLSEADRRALLDGRWDNPEITGAVYGDELGEAQLSGRIRSVPHEKGLPVYTFWDLGRNDTTAIWFMQDISGEYRFIDYYEDSGQQIADYARVLQDRQYLYGGHYLPHDGAVTDLSGFESRRDILERAGLHPIDIVPRIKSLGLGIEMTRRVLHKCYFDKTKCAGGINALRSYRRRFNADLQQYSDDPIHDWSSNGSDAFRQFAQGYCPTPVMRNSARPVKVISFSGWT